MVSDLCLYFQLLEPNQLKYYGNISTLVSRQMHLRGNRPVTITVETQENVHLNILANEKSLPLGARQLTMEQIVFMLLLRLSIIVIIIKFGRRLIQGEVFGGTLSFVDAICKMSPMFSVRLY